MVDQPLRYKGVVLEFDAPSDGEIVTLITEADLRWNERCVRELGRSFFEEPEMTEQEYEKSIARPCHERSGDDLDHKAEREFSRGVWVEHKKLREKVEDLARKLFDSATTSRALTVPIPDAPKPDPAFRTTEKVIEIIVNDHPTGKLGRELADEIIREVRARTVK